MSVTKSDIMRALRRMLVLQLPTSSSVPKGALKLLPHPKICASQKPRVHNEQRTIIIMVMMSNVEYLWTMKILRYKKRTLNLIRPFPGVMRIHMIQSIFTRVSVLNSRLTDHTHCKNDRLLRCCFCQLFKNRRILWDRIWRGGQDAAPLGRRQRTRTYRWHHPACSRPHHLLRRLWRFRRCGRSASRSRM